MSRVTMHGIRVMVFPLALKLNLSFRLWAFLAKEVMSWFSENWLGCFNPSDDCIRVSWTTYTKNSIEIFLRRYLPVLLFNCVCLISPCGLCCVAFLLIVLFRFCNKSFSSGTCFRSQWSFWVTLCCVLSTCLEIKLLVFFLSLWDFVINR